MEVQSDIVNMAHMALGHLKVPKKRDLLLVAVTMSQEKFDQLADEKEKLVVESVASCSVQRSSQFALIQLVVNSTDTNNSSDKTAVEKFENEGRVMGNEERGFSE